MEIIFLIICGALLTCRIIYVCVEDARSRALENSRARQRQNICDSERDVRKAYKDHVNALNSCIADGLYALSVFEAEQRLHALQSYHRELTGAEVPVDMNVQREAYLAY